MQHPPLQPEDSWWGSASVGTHRRQEAEVEELLMAMPSFRRISGGQEGPPLVIGYLHELDEGETEEEEEFEFGSASRDALNELEPVDAEEVFSDGCIRPVYPLFRRALVFDEGGGKPKISAEEIRDGDGDCDSAGALRLADDSIDFCLSFRDLMSDQGSPSTISSSSSGSSDSPADVDAVPVESLCVSSPVPSPPSPDPSKKSQSAGAFPGTSKKWRLLNLISRLSRSDGKERFLFVAASTPSATETSKNKDYKKSKALPASLATSAAGEEKKGKAGKGGAKLPMEMDMAAAHRLHYAKGGAAAGDRRRSFLPYRKDLFGFFAHVTAGASTSTKLSPRVLFKFF